MECGRLAPAFRQACFKEKWSYATVADFLLQFSLVEERDDLAFIVEPFVEAEGVEGDASSLQDEGFGEGDGLAFVADGPDEVDGDDLAFSLNEEVDGDAGEGILWKGFPTDGTECWGEVGEGGLEAAPLIKGWRGLLKVAADQ